MKYLLISSVFCVFVLYGCNGTYSKPSKYNRNGIEYPCRSYYVNDKLTKILCLDDDGDTLLIDNYKGDKLNGLSKIFHTNGNIKEIGNYLDNWKVGVWKSYYPSGVLESYRYYNPDLDSLNLYYYKKYGTDGGLDSLMYHLIFDTPNDTQFIVGDTFQLDVTLDYSEFDSIHVAGLIEYNAEHPGFEDTLWYTGNTLICEIVPLKVGSNIVEGKFIELNGNIEDVEEAFGGERFFRYEYQAISD